MRRQLAAILYADVAGYSRLTGQNEERTHQQLNTGLNLLTENIAAHGGSKIHEAGDAILAEFSSVTAAVEAAIEFQKSMAERHLSSSEGEAIEFRIGVNLGEVIHDRDDIYGDGVNIAARIQEIATPGSLCISGAVFDQLSVGTEFSFDDLGYRDFKNIERPVHVYQIRPMDLYGGHPMSSIESRVQGQPMFDDEIEKHLVTKGQCVCGSIVIEISQKSLGTGFCHCKICRRSTGAPIFSWVAFPVEAVKFTGDQPKHYRLSLIAERGFCDKCGSPVMWRGLKPEATNYIAIPTSILDNPEDFAPTWHGGIESQIPWLQIHDDLPRTRCEESPFLKKAWGSMGAPDPEKWVSLEYEQSKNLDDDPKSS
jgi:adenylate cyclase